jgi:hypothetical protein
MFVEDVKAAAVVVLNAIVMGTVPFICIDLLIPPQSRTNEWPYHSSTNNNHMT